MSDEDIVAFIRQYLADMAANGSPALGGNWAYDDYGLQNTIGGVGATAPMYVGAAVNPSLTGQPSIGGGGPPGYLGDLPMLPSGQTWLGGTTPAPGWIDVPISAGLLPSPRPQPGETHSWGTGPIFWEDGTLRNPFSDQPHLLRPSFQPMPRNILDQPSTAKKVRPRTQASRDEPRNPVAYQIVRDEPRNPVVYQPSPVVRTLVAAPTNAVARNLFR